MPKSATPNAANKKKGSPKANHVSPKTPRAPEALRRLQDAGEEVEDMANMDENGDGTVTRSEAQHFRSKESAKKSAVTARRVTPAKRSVHGEEEDDEEVFIQVFRPTSSYVSAYY